MQQVGCNGARPCSVSGRDRRQAADGTDDKGSNACRHPNNNLVVHEWIIVGPYLAFITDFALLHRHTCKAAQAVGPRQQARRLGPLLCSSVLLIEDLKVAKRFASDSAFQGPWTTSQEDEEV